jgi:hypothetical protein
MADVRVEAWRVHDTGLVAVPSRFRRLGGLVRHLQGQGAAWPDAVTLWLTAGALQVTGADGLVGVWPVADVNARRVATGPPVSFVLEVPGGAHLLAAAADDTTESLLAQLS